nr:hypothetical protein [Tanacetum cinerariifolium]
MDLLYTLLETCTTLTRRVEHLEQVKIDQTLEITKLKQRVKKFERRNKLKVSKLRRLKKVTTAQSVDTSEDTIMDDVSKQGEIIANMDADKDVTLKDVAAVAKDDAVVEKDDEIKENADVQGRQANATITAADTPITTATLTTTPSATRRRKGVVIRDPEETAAPSIIIHSEPKSKDKGKGIMRKEKEDNVVMRYQALKRKPQTEAQARKNTMIYLRNMAAFKMDYFKGMSYDDIHPIFEKYFNSNVAFLEKTKEQMEEEDSRALKRTSENQVEKATKKHKLDEEVKELKKHLQIVPNDEDDVYTEATPLALKVPIVDYAIHTKNNKPYFKIIRGDGTYQLFLSFLSLLRNFDREDLEVLWQIVPNDEDDVYTEATPLALKVPIVDYAIHTKNNKPYFKIIRGDGTYQLFLSFLSLLRNFDREDLEVLWQIGNEKFASSKPKNFSDDFLITTLTYMFEKPNVEAQVWKSQRGIYGLEKVKS